MTMTPQNPPRLLIEEWLPAAAIGVECMRERGSASALAPHTYLHIWWARRPLTASRAAVLGSLLPADFPRDVFERLLGFGRSGNELVEVRRLMDTGYRVDGGFNCDRAFKSSLRESELAKAHNSAMDLWGKEITVIDPMAGGGSIPLESARLGFKTIANEYNPVACSVLEATVDYPFRFGETLGPKARKWAKVWGERVEKRLATFYPIHRFAKRLMAGRGVSRALILLPAGLLKQWQTELREKGGMVWPRLEGINTLVWPDDKLEKVRSLEEALERDLLLMSRETARTENNLPFLLAARPWDLVILDESHAARRRKQEEGEFNSGTLLLNLLRQLQLRRRARGFLLMSATPMQTHPWEPWDLLCVLGEGGEWLSEFSNIREYYHALSAVRNGRCNIEIARKAAGLISKDSLFPPPHGEGKRLENESEVVQRLVFVPGAKRDEIARWLRSGAPLGRRMHRNTRKTLRHYYEMGLLPDPPPDRRVLDLAFDFEDIAERQIYNRVGQYIEKRYRELEIEKPGKGFVMTVYRRRASSSPLALERSLNRRRDGLRLVVEKRAYDHELAVSDVPEALDPDDLPEEEGAQRISAALPQDPQVARNELVELEQVLDELRELRSRDTKRDKFFEVLRQITEDGRSVLIFTEYVDTLEYLRDNLTAHYGKSLGCYSGAGGQRWDGEGWKSVTKDAITKALRNRELQAVICTDAASEGLNLQAAGAVINYDLPWNPSKVEQRIGRIDRIGQRLSEVRVVNLFLKDSVDDKVYGALHSRCGLFEHFVGPMQPVLAHARKMLLGQELVDLHALTDIADQVELDPLSKEIYIESEASEGECKISPLNRVELWTALSRLTREIGFRVDHDGKSETIKLSGIGKSKAVLSSKIEVLERDHRVLPLSPLEPRLKQLAESLDRPGERLPLVIGSFQKGGFRRSVAYWVDKGSPVKIESFQDLEKQGSFLVAAATNRLKENIGVKPTLYTLRNALGMNLFIFSISRMCMTQISQAKPSMS